MYFCKYVVTIEFHIFTTMYNGTNFVVAIDTITPITAERGTYANYRPVICGTSNGLSVDFESISFRNKCDGGWDKSVSGYGSWDFTVDGMAYAVKNSEKLLKANFQEVAELAIDKQIFWAKTADVNSSIVREGLVRIGSYKETADLEQPYTFNVSFVGIGKPLFEATPAPPTPGTLTIQWGFTETDPYNNEASVTPQFSKTTDNVSSINLDFSIASSGKFLFVVAPLAISNIYDKWYNNQFNSGTIPDFAWRTPVTIGDNRYYITREELYITSAEPTITFSK